METLTFKTEAEREAALAAIPEDPPAGVKVADWPDEMANKLEAINNAKIVGEDGEPVETTDEPEEKPPEDTALSDHEIRLQNALEDRRKMQEKMKQQEIEYQKKIKELESREPEKPAAPVIDPAFVAKEKEYNDTLTQFEDLNKAMAEIDDPADPDYIRALQKQTTLGVKMNRITSDLHKIELQKRDKELDHIKTSQRKEIDEKKQREQESEAETKRKTQVDAQNKALEDLRNSDIGKPFFKSKTPMAKMHADYSKFAFECAMAYTGKAPNEVEDADVEVAIQRYQSKLPALLEKLEEKRIKAPADMQEFIDLTNVYAIKEGVSLDPKTGKWVELLDTNGNKINFPDVESAFNYYKKKAGLTQKEKHDIEKETADNLMKAINKKAGVNELADLAQSAGAEPKIDKKAAEIIFEKYDQVEMINLARANSKSPKLQAYNKALAALGLPVVDETW